FIPKGKRMSDYSLDDIAFIEDWMNTLPRRILNYKTPEELFELRLDEIYSI
ncbi:IS30 family transposase, partial [Clostridium botulinum]|nr:IS30 family transposase [Clostridium botulinum]NFL46417.1 IS30 family transposase [Clostridium botulinum]NFL91233.1 IS30 family transposase [Clostridium botulinum]